jgi:hypothetical protein
MFSYITVQYAIFPDEQIELYFKERKRERETERSRNRKNYWKGRDLKVTSQKGQTVWFQRSATAEETF